MSKTKTPTIKTTSVPSAYDTPMTTLEYLRKVESQNAQVLARQDEIEEALNGLHTEIAGVSNSKVSKSGDTMTGALNTPQVNADTGVLHHMNVVSQDEKTHVEADNNGFVAEVSVPDLNKKFTFGVGSNGKVALNVHDVPNNRDTLFMFPNADDYGAGTYELATKDDIPEPSGGSSLLEDIEDSDGHKRFQKIVGSVNTNYLEDIYTYTLVNGNALTLIGYANCAFAGANIQADLFTFTLPDWVANLINPSSGRITKVTLLNVSSGDKYELEVSKTGNTISFKATSSSPVNLYRNFLYRAEVTLGL